jgi:hypothetical protein
LKDQTVIKKKYDELKSKFEKEKNEHNLTINMSKDLESKIKFLEEENCNLRKCMAFEKESLEELLKQKMASLKNELKYKDSKLESYEKLLHKGI